MHIFSKLDFSFSYKLDFSFSQIEYFNNQIIVDLVEQPHKGIISVLDEACLTAGKVTDTVCLESMNKKLGQHPHYTSRKVSTQNSHPFLLASAIIIHIT